MAPKTSIVYRELDMVPIPEDIPELGIKAGYLGTVDFVYAVRDEPGRGLHVEVSRDDGSTIGFVQLEADEEGAWHVMVYSVFG
ncbi:MAG: hypothetical protein H0T57_11515 [Rubrobacter sp.]|nr:hypothetical protein [Rubrobacter sp.]